MYAPQKIFYVFANNVIFGTVVVFALTKTVSMKKTIFVLPLCLFFAFCSSSRKAATPAGPGISNVNVSRGDTMTSAAKAGASFTSADRDWSYTANRDTSLNGTWTLDGMIASNGSWSNTSTWYQDTSMTAMESSMNMGDTSSMNMATVTSDNDASMSAKNKKTRARSRSKRNALYDTAKARLNMDYKSTSTLDTTVQPFQYWKRIPTLTLNPTRLVFTGNTGCNSMSGTFNFSSNNIQFGRNVITSKMACNEYDESAFLNALKRADSYTLNGNTLELKQGNTLLLTFRKS